jgi:hypothetical protein
MSDIDIASQANERRLDRAAQTLAATGADLGLHVR